MCDVRARTSDPAWPRRPAPDPTGCQVQSAHEPWIRATISLDDLQRAHQLGMAMVDVGDDPETVEHQLVAIGVGEAVAAQVADNIGRLRVSSRPDVTTVA